MKEKPLLFCGDMVRGLLEDRKTQTRRIVNMKTLRAIVRGTVRGDWIYASTMAKGKCKVSIAERGAVSVLSTNGQMLGVKPGEFDFVCPYCAGTTHLENLSEGRSRWFVRPDSESVIWIRETWADVRGMGFEPEFPNGVAYRADCTDSMSLEIAAGYGIKWTPSIFMERWASRLSLKPLVVRIERLQEITSSDAIAEGIERVSQLGILRSSGWRDYSEKTAGFMNPVQSYRSLWNRLNLDPAPVYAKLVDGTKAIVGYQSFPWSAEDFDAKYPGVPRIAGTYREKPLTVTPNPWLWVIDFKKLEVSK